MASRLPQRAPQVSHHFSSCCLFVLGTFECFICHKAHTTAKTTMVMRYNDAAVHRSILVPLADSIVSTFRLFDAHTDMLVIKFLLDLVLPHPQRPNFSGFSKPFHAGPCLFMAGELQPGVNTNTPPSQEDPCHESFCHCRVLFTPGWRHATSLIHALMFALGGRHST